MLTGTIIANKACMYACMYIDTLNDKEAAVLLHSKHLFGDID